MMAATKSFEAAFGTAQMTAFGAGAEIDIWKHLFVRVAGTRARKTGSRVFVDSGEVFDLGIPMTVTLTPIEAGGGWRFGSRGRIAPYIGASFVSLAYHQESDFAEAGDNVSESFMVAEAFGGVAIGITKGFFVGGEAKFRSVTVPDAVAQPDARVQREGSRRRQRPRADRLQHEIRRQRTEYAADSHGFHGSHAAV